MKVITRTVWILSLVSFFTDAASEMLYPVMPLYLKSIGFSVAYMGILEGIAEATTGLSKGYFGKLSDTYGKRVPFVRLGYSLSAISKPLLAIFPTPVFIFIARTADRLGKGIRTASRDAMLANEAAPENKGKVFGFHRSMDTWGAVAGPLFALLFLSYNPENYKTLFYFAFIPGMLAIVFTFLLKEKNHHPTAKTFRPSLLSFFNFWNESPSPYKKLVIGLLLFALFNSSDVFLLLKIKETGFSDIQVIGVYIFYNLIYALLAYPIGKLADKIGLKNIFILGLTSFVIVYAGMAYAKNFYQISLLFFLYGVYGAATEGISKAWISNTVSKSQTATAIGTYSAMQSICALAASSLTGFIWYMYGSTTALTLPALATSLIIFYFSSKWFTTRSLISQN